MHDKLCNGRSYKMLTVLDEYTRQALAVAVRTRMGADDVLEALYPLLLRHGTPEYIRSDNGPEFVAQAMQDWLARVGIKPIRIYPGSPWENGYNERFNGTLRREVLNAEWFTTTKQAQVVINQWLRQYNHIRPHQALNHAPSCSRNSNQEWPRTWGLDKAVSETLRHDPLSARQPRADGFRASMADTPRLRRIDKKSVKLKIFNAPVPHRQSGADVYL